MSRRDTLVVNTGAAPNDGLGEPIRSGFIKVNDNFEAIDTRLILGNLPVVVSNTITASSTTTANLTVTSRAVITASSALIIDPGTQGTMDNVRIGATTPRPATFTTLTADTITSNGTVNVIGNLVISGNLVTQNSSDLIILDSIINLHTTGGLTPLTVDDGKDIGIKFHYYKTQDNHAFLGWANDTGYLEYYAAGSEVANVFNGTAYGTIKTGEFFSVNTTAATSTTSGAIVTYGGIGASGDIYSANMVTGNITANTLNLTTATAGTATITNLQTTNVSTGNAQITGGNISVNYLRASNFSSPNVLIGGGRVEGLAALQANNFSTGNAVVTGGTIDTMIRVNGTLASFTTGSFTNIFASNTLISNSSVHTNTLYSDGYFWGNGTYLLTGVDSSLGAVNANIGAYQTWANANVSGLQTSIDNLNSNVGAYEIWANANVSSLQSSINNLWSNAAGQATSLGSSSSDINNLWANAASQATLIDTLSTIKANLTSPAFTGGVGITGNVDVTGYIIATQDVIAFSDEKYKTNVTTITNALATVRLLRGVNYDRVDTGEQGTGVIAQESQPHTPRLVRKTDNGDLAVAYGNHAGYFIEAIKELADTVDEMAHEIKLLKKEIKRLKGE